MAEQQEKGLGSGKVGLISGAVIGISVIAPAYTLSGALGPTASAVGEYLPAIFLVGFIPMLLVSVGYRELNKEMPDSGTTFTWATRAFGPVIGWLGGWGLLAACILVLSNLAGIAVDFFYLMLSQVFRNPELAELTRNVPVNILTCFGVYLYCDIHFLPGHGHHENSAVRAGCPADRRAGGVFPDGLAQVSFRGGF